MTIKQLSIIWGNQRKLVYIQYNQIHILIPHFSVESSSEDESKKLRRMQTHNIRNAEASDNSYPHSSNRTYSYLEDFQDFSSLTSEGEL